MADEMKIKLLIDTSQLEKAIGNLSIGGGQVAGASEGGDSMAAAGAIAGAVAAGTAGILQILDKLLGSFLEASGFLKSAFTMLAKQIGLLLRPLTDMIALGLMPIIHLLRPISLFINTLMRPYIQRAMLLTAIGGQAIAKGDYELATTSFNAASRALITPFISAMISGVTTAFSFMFDMMSKLFQNIPGLSWLGTVFAGLSDSAILAGESIQNSLMKELDTIMLGIALIAKERGYLVNENFMKTINSMIAEVHSPETIENIQNEAQQFADNFLGVATNLTDDQRTSIQDWGSDVIYEFGRGIAGAIADVVSSMIQEVKDAARRAASFSPSANLVVTGVKIGKTLTNQYKELANQARGG